MKDILHKGSSLLLALVLLITASVGLVKAENETPQSTNTIYLPLAINLSNTTFVVSGTIQDEHNRPIAGIVVRTDSGEAAVTDQKGNYQLKGLSNSVYTLTPSQTGMAFYPPSSQVVLPPSVSQVNFIASTTQCSEAIVNGGFENDTGWELPVTAYQAGYSTALARTGTQSMRTGIVVAAHNRYSYSSIRQAVQIPANVTSATVRFWVYPISGEPTSLPLAAMPSGGNFEQSTLASDIQYILVLDAANNWIDTLVWQRSNSQTWTYHEYDLKKFAGRTIKLHFGTYNDGLNGITAMYVDDVSVELCPESVVPTPTSTPLPSACYNLIGNSSFETTASWEIPLTVYPAGYSTAIARTGSQSMRSGIVVASHNRYSYSDFRQTVTIPSGTVSARLGIWVYPLSGETPTMALAGIPESKNLAESTLASDVQYLLVLNSSGIWIDTLLWQRSNSQTWTYHEFELRRYAGQTIKLQFGTYNDGLGGITAMYVDDVMLDICGQLATPTPTLPPGPTPTLGPTATPSVCTEKVVNTGFELETGWQIPITRYSAGYSAERAHAGTRSMRTGIVIASHNRYSYSDAWQAVTIASNAVSARLRLWAFSQSGEASTLSLPEIPKTETFGEAPLASDVQYFLILDAYGNWIDTLIWQRSNTQVWSLFEFDLRKYAGRTIRLQFGTYNDGLSGITAMYVDDVSLEVCQP